MVALNESPRQAPPITRPRPRLHPALAVVPIAASGVLAGWAATSSASALMLLAIAGTAAQVAGYLLLVKVVLRRGIAVSASIGLAWLVYFTFRLGLTQMDRDNLNENIAVRGAGDGAFVWAWLLTTLCLYAFVLGVKVGGASRLPNRRRVDLSTRSLLVLATVGLLGRYAMVFGGIQSGFIESIMSLYLLAFGALGYHSVTNRAIRRPLYALVTMASVVGILTSFKEAAVIPIAALLVGVAAAGVKVSKTKLVGLMLLGVWVFLTVQGNRVAFDLGDDVPIYEAAVAAITDYNIESGLRGRPGRPPNEAAWDVVQGLSRRFGGVTGIIVLHEKVPRETEFQNGKSIWQPILSSVPLAPNYVHLEFPQLSLGRYFTTEFIADNPDDNLSSQAITMPGDLYLNFGFWGAVIGMGLWGVATGRIDRTFPPTSATKVGVIVFVGHILIGVERNVGFLAVNGAIRVTLVLLLLRAAARWGERQRGAGAVTVAGASDPLDTIDLRPAGGNR